MMPYSSIMEKSLLPLGGKPIIRMTIEELLASGIVAPEDITISVLPDNRDIFLHEFRDLSVNIKTIEESPNTATHYYIIANRIGEGLSYNDDVMIHYGDNISAIDYKKFYNEYLSAQEYATDIHCCIAGTMLIRHDYSAIRSTSRMDQFLKDNMVTPAKSLFDMVIGFKEKPFLSERGWMGVAIFKNGKMMEMIEKVMNDKDTNSVDFGYDILPRFAEAGHVILYKHEGEWFDVGNSVSYMRLRKRIAKGEKIV